MSDLDILLVEDNEGDIRLIERAVEKRNVDGTLHFVQTGEEALDWLHQRGSYDDAPVPDIVLLDLKMPGADGHRVLRTIKSDDWLKRIPVVVLTNTRSETELIEVYEEGANACTQKPVEPEDYAERIEAITDFWASTAKLPPTDRTDRDPSGRR